MLRDLQVDGQKCSFNLYSKNKTPTVGLANAIRRALIMDIKTLAPHNVIIHKNTSCATDEYIAHRIGMIPFKNVTENTKLVLKKEDTLATTDDISGSFSLENAIPIILLNVGQSIDLEISFDEKTGNDHARYSKVCGVGYKIQRDNIAFQFETLEDDPLVLLKLAFEKLMSRLSDTRRQIEKTL